MTNIISDLEPNDEVFKAIQIVLNAFSRSRKQIEVVRHERDTLKAIIEKFEMENPLDDSSTTELNEYRRKRIRIDSTKIEDLFHTSSTYDTNDDLNAAFSASTYDDEMIAPTQFEVSSVKSKKPIITRKHNKENNADTPQPLKALNMVNSKEKSPTVLSKRSFKTEIEQGIEPMTTRDIELNEGSLVRKTKSMSILNESPKWQTKTFPKNVSPRRLFENKLIEKNTTVSPQLQKSSTNSRKKSTFSTLKFPGLKQSTIKFSKFDDETYCESASIQADDKESQIPGISEIRLNIKNEPQSSLKDSVIAFITDTKEVINVEESQPTQELYQHVFDIKEEISNEMTETLHIKTPNACKNLQNKEISTGCEDCDQYHRMIGRDMYKNPSKKYGVCSKHHRNVQCLNTPPGFWNPKIIDSDSDDETPYDLRFVKKKKL